MSPIDFKTLGMKTEVPRTYVNNRLIIAAQWINYDYLTVEYQNFFVVGGVIQFDLLEYPQNPRIENGMVKFRFSFFFFFSSTQKS